MKTLHSGPKEVFLQSLMMVLLYISVISAISLCFAYINFLFPDTLNFYLDSILGSIRSASATLIVSTPLYLYLAHLVRRDLDNTPAKHDLGFRRWIIYITLFVASITLIIDAIALVNGFYNGELTAPFLLKVLTILLAAGGAFAYLLWDVQHSTPRAKPPIVAGWILGSVAALLIILGFIIVGTPQDQRQLRMDQERIQDLSYLQWELHTYWGRQQDVPESLSALENAFTGVTIPTDPLTGEAYEYQRINERSFSLCADFQKASITKGTDPHRYASQGFISDGSDQFWEHSAGRHCFERTIDPSYFKDHQSISEPMDLPAEPVLSQ